MGTPVLENREMSVLSQMSNLDFKREKGTIAYLGPDMLKDKIILHMILFYFTWMTALSVVVITFYLYLFLFLVTKQMRARQNVDLLTTFGRSSS